MYYTGAIQELQLQYLDHSYRGNSYRSLTHAGIQAEADVQLNVGMRTHDTQRRKIQCAINNKLRSINNKSKKNYRQQKAAHARQALNKKKNTKKQHLQR